MNAKPWIPNLDVTYFNNCFCPTNLDNILTKWTVLCDVDKLVYVEWICNQQVFPPKNCMGTIQWALVYLGTNLIYITGNKNQTLTSKPLLILLKKLLCAHQTLARISQKTSRVMLINICMLNVLLLTFLKQT